MKRLFSNCCNSTYHSEWSGYDKGRPSEAGTTCYYVCDKCGSDCDLIKAPMKLCKTCNGPIPTESRTMKKSTYCSYECYLKFNGKRLKNMRRPLRKTVDKDDLLAWIERNQVICCNNFSPTIEAKDLIQFINHGVQFNRQNNSLLRRRLQVRSLPCQPT